MSNCNDSYNGKDKVKHFCACLALSVICPLVAVAAAVGKEVYDSVQQRNHFCLKDVVADGIGIILGSVIHTIIILTTCLK